MSSYTNTGALVRLGALRDRIKLPLWVLGLSVFVPYVLTAYTTVFGSPEDRRTILGMLANPATTIFTGPGYGLNQPPELVSKQVIFTGIYWGYLLIFTGLMNILLVTRHTRLEEQAGRAELVRADVVGRNAPLTSALLLALVADVVLGALIAAAFVAFGGALGSSVLVGVGTAAFGLFFAGLAAVTVQLSAVPAGASGLAGAVLALAFVLRGLGDTLADPGQHGSWLSWFSPFAWTQQTAAFVLDRWWPLAIPVLGAVLLVGLAYRLSARRDLGAGLIEGGAGPVHAPASWGGPLGLARVLQRPNARWWTVGLVAAAIVYGSFSGVMVDAFGDLPEIFRRLMGGADGALEGYLTLTQTMFRIATAIYAVGAIAKLLTEEHGGRTEPVLATPVTARAWLASHTLVAVVAAAVMLLLAGALAGGFAARVAGSADWIGKGVAAAAAGIPAILLVIGLAVALYAVTPRLVPLAWLPVVLGGLIEIFGDLLKVPAWARQISPFEHTPALPAESFALTPVLVQLAVAVVLLAFGWWWIRRRDIEGL